MSDPELAHLARRASQARRLPAGACCATCGGADHLIVGPDDRILCYGDRQAERGRRGPEHDHLAGRANLAGITVDLVPNDHRTVTEWRTRLGFEAWPRAEDDDLLRAAHLIGGLASILLLIADWLVSVATNGLGSRPIPVVA